MNDEKTTEIELPAPMGNIVRVDFSERRKAPRAAGPLHDPIPPRPLERHVIRHGEPLVLPHELEWEAPLWLRLAALGAILILSLFVL